VQPELAQRVARAVGVEPVAATAPLGTGYTHNERWILRLADDRTAFVKGAVDGLSAEWLRFEHRVYAAVEGDFLAAMLGWDDDGAHPVLVLEDLSAAHWPPPWSPERVTALLDALERIAATPAPAGLPSLEERRDDLAGWERVAEDPQPFLSLGLCSPRWLEEAMPALLAASQNCVLAGDSFLHFDVRSDNVCFDGERVVLVDWNWAAVGNPVVDVAAWLPSLEAEGGPPPEEILPDAPEAASFVAGFFAARTGLPPPPTTPRVREVQLAQLRTALPWAARALALRAPDGL
jgi:Phosphotransferase enzyme family